jgi:uncharacterized membrane protein YfcA
MRELLLPLLGLVVGTLGTLVGAGGGFVLVPVLLFLYPDEPPKVITAISLAVVCINALSGSAAYAWQRRIDYRTGVTFAVATIPGSVLGVYAVRFLPRTTFNLLFGLLMIAIAFIVSARPTPKIRERVTRKGEVLRTLRDRFGHTYVWSFRPVRGVVLSFFVGFLSSILGIGGGPIQVPMMVLLLAFPIHIATATSQFIVVAMSATGSITHIAAGEFGEAWRRTLLIGSGVVVGAQLGAAIAPRARPALITRALAVSLALVGLRLIVKATGH